MEKELKIKSGDTLSCPSSNWERRVKNVFENDDVVKLVNVNDEDDTYTYTLSNVIKNIASGNYILTKKVKKK